MATKTIPPLSEKQRSFIDRLVGERQQKLQEIRFLMTEQGGSNEYMDTLDRLYGQGEYLFEGEVTVREASEVIDWLMQSVRRDPRPEDAEVRKAEAVTPAGRYAVEVEGILRFYRVDKPTEGRWAGYTFLNRQASDDFFPVRDRTEKVKVLGLIDADPRAAAIRYGLELGVCSLCGRVLTDPDSRAAGVGPICAARVGW